MAMAPYRCTSERIAKRWRSKNIITSMGFEFTGVLFSFFRYFFRFQMYLTSVNSQLIFFLYIFYLKKTQRQKTMKYSEKMNSLKKGEGVPLLNFEGSPRVPLLNFRGVSGSTFKL